MTAATKWRGCVVRVDRGAVCGFEICETAAEAGTALGDSRSARVFSRKRSREAVCDLPLSHGRAVCDYATYCQSAVRGPGKSCCDQSCMEHNRRSAAITTNVTGHVRFASHQHFHAAGTLGSLHVLPVNPDGIRLEILEVVQLPPFFREDMQHNIAKVHQDPVSFGAVAFHA